MSEENVYYSASPITGKKTGPYKNMNRDEVNKLIIQAKVAQVGWGELPIKKRFFYIKKIIKVITGNLEHYGQLIHEDNGKSQIESLGSEFVSTLLILKYYLKHAKKILKKKKADTISFLPGMQAYILKQPIGVVGAIGPWNYPFQLSFIPAISAVIAGNAVLVKVSSSTPSAGVIIEDIIKRSGLPQGVLNVIWGKGISGQYLAEGDIQKLFFTGSTVIGKKLAKICAEKLIPVDLELGGSDPLVILEGADLDRTAKGVVWSCLYNTGQTCVSTERIYVTEKDHDKFVEILEKKIKDITIGPNDDDDFGAMTTNSQIEIVKEQLNDAVKKGAMIKCGGNVDGNFFEPTLVLNCDHSMDLINEETFGPILAIVKTKNDEESLKLANDSKYGLCATIFGDPKKAKKYALEIRTGTVNINNTSMLSFITPSLPHGGLKESGIGKIHGDEGLLAFCNTKSILIDKLTFLKDSLGWAPYGKNGYKKYVRFIKIYWGTSLPLRILSALPVIFKRKK